jgi:hypothetical protein
VLAGKIKRQAWSAGLICDLVQGTIDLRGNYDSDDSDNSPKINCE